MSPYRTKMVSQINPEITNEWKTLWLKAKNANLFNSFDWFVMYIETTHKPYELYLTYKGKELVGVLPLCFSKCFGVNVMSPMNRHFSVNTPFLLESYDEELLYSLFQTAMSKRNLFITKIESEIVMILHKLFPELFFSLMAANPYIDLTDEPLRFVSKLNLKEMRRILRKYGQQLEFKTFDQHGNLPQLLEEMFDIDVQSGKKQRAMDIFSHSENREIFRNFVKYLRPFIWIHFMYYDQKPIAYVFNFMWKQTFLAYQASYLFDYRRVGPGKTIMMSLLEKLKRGPFTLFDFSGGVSSYKRDFTPYYYLQYNLFFARNPLIMFWWKAVNLARRTKQLLFPLKNTRDHEFLFKVFDEAQLKQNHL